MEERGFVRGRILAGKSTIYDSRLYPEGVIKIHSFNRVSQNVGSHGTLEFKIWSGDMAGNSIPYLIHQAIDASKLTIERLEKIKGPIMEVRREVPPGHQEKGIGTELLRRAERYAASKGVEFIFADTKNPHAIKGYKHLGWEYLWKTIGGNFCYGKFLGE